MENIILKEARYYITAKSKLFAKLYNGHKGVDIKNIIGPFKKGTLSEFDNVPPKGLITVNSQKNGYIKVEYEAVDGFIGDDDIEFIIEFEDGAKAHQVIYIKVKEKVSLNTVMDTFYDLYMDNEVEALGNKIVRKISSKYSQALDVPTCVSYSSLAEDLKTIKGVSLHNETKSYFSIINEASKTLIETYTKPEMIPSNIEGKSINTIRDIEITVTKDANYFGNEYGLIKFKGFVNKETLKDVDMEEHIYINWKLRTIDYKGKEASPKVEIPKFKEFPTPNFVTPIVDYPQEPTQSEYAFLHSGTDEGELFELTKAHREFDARGNHTIRVGQVVPKNAVNLAYYHNKTAGMEDTISVIETNMNNVTLHYAEDWIHKRNLNSKNEELFPNYIEFEGKEGTYLEGYCGTLYREYVAWEEQTMADLEPTAKRVHQEYRGLKKDSLDNLPLKWNYKDKEKSGVLELTNRIVESIDNLSDGTPTTYAAYCRYEGIVSKTRVKYHGTAKYGGIVTKKDGMTNIDPEQPKELIMFPDDFGILHTVNGETKVDDDLFLITDKFVDKVPLYYKHRLKHRIYDSVGPDKYGVYNSSSVRLELENGYELDSDKYKWKLFIEPTEWVNIYDAYIYTSFIPKPNSPIFVIYDGMPEESYKGKECINPSNSKLGEKEQISVYPAINKDGYIVDNKSNSNRQSVIKMNKIDVIKDERAVIPIEYVIIADDMETPVLKCNILNHKYAIGIEKKSFINEEMIVSKKTPEGFMTAKDMFLELATEEQKNKLKETTIFRLRFNNEDGDTFKNKEKVIMYTAPNGSGLIMAQTFYDTGLPGKIEGVTTLMDRKVPEGYMYQVKDGKIYKGFSVLCKNVNQITIAPPIETEPLKSWRPRVNYSYFNKTYERIDKTIELIYSVPEFYAQLYGKYGRPYVDVKGEKAKHLGNNKIKVNRSPLYVDVDSGDWQPKNIKGCKILPGGSKRVLTIKSYNLKYGVIEFVDKISHNDLIEIDYTYEEEFYHYRGYYKDGDARTKMIEMNLNPNIYNYFTDNSDEVLAESNVYNLFNRTVHFFLKPTRIIDKSTNEILEENHFTIYHRVDTPDAIGAFDLHIGRIFIRHHSSLKSTEIVDTRSRGGGVLESMKDDIRRELEPESDFYLDIGTTDGTPYHENSVVVVKIDERVLSRFGGRFSEYDVEEAVRKWAACGMFPIIKYVKTLSEEDLPQSSMVVSTEIKNKFKFKPYIRSTIVEA